MKSNHNRDGVSVDEFIRPLVVFMNECGMETVASCHGHLSQAKDPYVLFKGNISSASAFSTALYNELLQPTVRLNFYWVIEGHFNPLGELLFRLSSPELQKKAFSIFHITTTPYMRARINHDLFVMQEIVQQALLADSHKHNNCRNSSENDHD